VLQTARKDLASVAQQAQQELGKLQQPSATNSTTTSPDPNAAPTPNDSDTPADTYQASDASSSPVQSTSTNIFSFWPIPPTQIAGVVQKTLSEGSANIQSTLQRTLSDPQVQQIKSTLTANLYTLQENVHHIQENVVTGVHHLQESLPDLQNVEARDKLLGDARKHGEDWLKQAGEFLQDAVKVVPPAPGQAGYQPGMIWDGSDVWMFSEAREEEAATPDQKGKGKEGFSVSRTGALLRKLRTDPEMIRAVPSGETYEWFCGEIDAKDGGLGSSEWKKKCEEVEKLDGLEALRESLVPSELDEETFWKRYWFRAWQIQQEEEKRKALLQGIIFSLTLSHVLDLPLPLASTETEKEEVFSWEDEEETDIQRTPKPSAHNVDPSASVTTLTAPATKDKSSPRESEDSYDLVSTRSGNASSGGLSPSVSNRPLPPSSLGSAAPITASEATTKKEGDDSDDSDWE
jgi:hypothetical protein